MNGCGGSEFGKLLALPKLTLSALNNEHFGPVLMAWSNLMPTLVRSEFKVHFPVFPAPFCLAFFGHFSDSTRASGRRRRPQERGAPFL